jgi:hypothetical protein
MIRKPTRYALVVIVVSTLMIANPGKTRRLPRDSHSQPTRLALGAEAVVRQSPPGRRPTRLAVRRAVTDRVAMRGSIPRDVTDACRENPETTRSPIA